jgi:hypothetical protein
MSVLSAKLDYPAAMQFIVTLGRYSSLSERVNTYFSNTMALN